MIYEIGWGIRGENIDFFCSLFTVASNLSQDGWRLLLKSIPNSSVTILASNCAIWTRMVVCVNPLIKEKFNMLGCGWKIGVVSFCTVFAVQVKWGLCYPAINAHAFLSCAIGRFSKCARFIRGSVLFWSFFIFIREYWSIILFKIWRTLYLVVVFWIFFLVW